MAALWALLALVSSVSATDPNWMATFNVQLSATEKGS